ncbi:ABC transporter ATP-binding protein [Compostimonas suwonensis]|uniref:NitT/TauT family transport system ATP-binding protein n=1 Tax=Compostimonas suwonensis TaxID=1048394 RepID=A0A2M9BBQ0_9MICO|nr:ABC transporter ATP-binding protein [Compostimonas suwonensis]PJJ55366.1 NitT/TauT family transport system ATP-binding protein [Compostimonas suwonensis]
MSVTNATHRSAGTPAASQTATRRGDPADASRGGALVVSGVSVKYQSQGDEQPVLAVDDVSLEAAPGEFVAIVGPSGCGKSTLLKAVAGLLPTSSGSVSFGGETQARLGFVFQSDALLPWKTAAENVEIAIKMSFRQVSKGRLSKAKLQEKAIELLEQFGLGESTHKYPAQLSGGMRKRVALARAVAYEPSAFLMDEPFSALDAQTRIRVGNFFLRMLEDLGQTVLFVTHDIEEAVAMADRVIVLSKGPGRVIETINVTIPRPRDYHDTRFHPLFKDLQQRVWDSLGYSQGATSGDGE